MIYGSIKGQHQLLHAYMLHHHFVYHLERNEVHIKEDFRSFFYLNAEIKQSIMGI